MTDRTELELTNPQDHHRVVSLWLLDSTATAAVLAALRREAVAGRARCTFSDSPPETVVIGRGLDGRAAVGG